MTKKVIIIGGGIAGLTAATLLNEAGFNVTLIEAASSVGGLAKSEYTKQGYPTEHSLRVFNHNYVCLFDIMGRFLKKDDCLVPVQLTFECIDHHSYLIRHTKKLIDVFKNFIMLQHFFKDRHITWQDEFYVLKNFLFYISACEARWLVATAKPVQDFFKNRSEGFTNTFLAINHMAYIAKRNTSEKLAMFYQGEHTFNYNYYMLNKPTSDALFNPWQTFLLKKNVQIHFNSMIKKFDYNEKEITGIELQSGEKLVADIYIFASSDRLYPIIFQNIPKMDPHQFNLESSNGCQFYLSDLPKKIDQPNLFRPGIINSFIDSPWKIVAVTQGSGFWNNVTLPAGCAYVLSVTVTETMTNGILHGKSFYECSETERIEEILAQIEFNELSLIQEHHLDDSICFFDSDQSYAEKKPLLPPHYAYRQKSGSWVINLSCLYTPTPDDVQHEPEAKTAYSNLYLAGHYCKTYMPIPTMEKASESGYRAASAILKDWLPNYKYHYPLRSYSTEHPFLRFLDAFLFRIFH